MNAFKRNSFWQKMFKGAVMIIILLQTACAANITNGSGAALICRMDAPGEVSNPPKTKPTTAIHFPQPLPKERLGEPVLDENTELILAVLLPIIEFINALSRCDGCFNFWGE